MDNKVYDLLEKVYIALQDKKKELKDTRISLENRISGVDTKLGNQIIKFENEFHDKIGSVIR